MARVMVLMGGDSAERDVSVATGYGVVQVLRERGHEVVPLDPATGTILPLEASPREIAGAPPSALKEVTSMALARTPEIHEVDVVFVALHGGSGEDGTLQAVLDLAGVPYTGSGMLASALAMDKTRTKALLTHHGVPVPRGQLFTRRSGAEALDPETVGGFPLVVKPNSQGSSVGVHLVETPEMLAPALDDAFQYGPVMIEEFIPGREVTVAVLAGEPLPVVEIIPQGGGFYDYEHKYTQGRSRYQVPAEIPPAVAKALAAQGKTAFEALGCAGVARVDFRLNPNHQAYCLEINTIPGMTATSLVPMAAKAAGISYGELVERLIASASKRPPK